MYRLIVLLIVPLFSFAQNEQKSYLDSIYSELDTIKDEERLFLSTYRIAEEHIRVRPEVSIVLGNRILANAEKEEDHRKKTSALYILGRAYFSNNQPIEAESIYKESIHYELSFSQVDTAKLAWVYHNAANYYKKRGGYLKAIELFSKSLALEEQRGHLENQASCHLNIGAMYLYLGQNKKAMKPLETSKEISLSIGDTATAQSCINNIALIYKGLGEYNKALKTLDTASKYTNQLYDQAYIYGDRASIYRDMGNIAKAVHFYQKAEDAFNKTGSQLEKARVMMDIGELFYGQKRYSRALKIYREAQHIFSRLENKDFQAKSFLNIGRLYDETNKLDSSLLYLKKSLSLAEEAGNIELLGQINLSLGAFFKERKDFLKAIPYLESSLQYFENAGSSSETIRAQVHLAQALNASGNKSDALQYIKQARATVQKSNNQSLQAEVLEVIIKDFYFAYSIKEIRDIHFNLTEIKDSLRSKENAKAIAKLSSNYKLKEMEDSIGYTRSLLDQQKEINNIESKVSSQQRQLIWLIGIGGLLLLILLLILFVNRRKIKIKNAENELLLGEIHHRVKNNLQVISSLLSLQEKNITDESAKKALSDGKSRVKSIGLIHKLLYQKDQFAGINIKEYTENILSTIAETHGYEKTDYISICNIDPLEIDADTAIPLGLIINELVNNTFKYAFKKGKDNEIKVEFKSKGDELNLFYVDSGKGNKSTLENTSSFGYRMILSLTRQLKGRVSIDDKKGLKYNFQIPKKQKT